MQAEIYRSAHKMAPKLHKIGARGARYAGGFLLGATLCLSAGCELDSYLDPSIVGRWEHTPTTTPILDRLSPIEDVQDGFVEYSEVSAEDLIPEAAAYRVASGDSLEISIEGLVNQGVREFYPTRVDAQGMISIPQLPPIMVVGLTANQVRDRVVQSIAQAGLFRDALVDVRVAEQRQQSYTVFGSVVNAGPYFIPKPDFRLLEALTTAGGFNESSAYVYVIRQVPLTDDSSPRATPANQPFENNTQDQNQPDTNFLDLIDDLTGTTAPSMMSASGTRRPTMQAAPQDSPDPIIDLVESRSGSRMNQTTAPNPGEAATRWVFLDGRWVQVAGSVAGVADGDTRGEALVTQRVIRVPIEPLINGDARYNIVVRPGDLIRVPISAQGNVYIAGQVNRPGVYALPATGTFTISRAITAAGGYGPTAIPERTDITRMVGTDRQATMRLNLRAIAEGTQPDLLLKPDDHVNVGTNFWAYPLAVVRNGLRFSYGFGFLVDRNFGNDIFGAPPSNNNSGN